MKTITILPTGDVEFLGDTCPVDLPLVNPTRRRVSTIVPLGTGKRLAFRLLRTCFGEGGRVAAFTRTWRCEWRATILATGQSAVFGSRAEAVRWEIETLEASYEQDDCKMLGLRVQQQQRSA